MTATYCERKIEKLPCDCEQCQADAFAAALEAPTAQPGQEQRMELHIVFDGPPGHEAGRFVECETPDGRSVNAGEWHERDDGFWELRLNQPVTRPTADLGEDGELRAAIIDARLALANWQKYNGEQSDEVVYQAEKMASAIERITSAVLSRSGL